MLLPEELPIEEKIISIELIRRHESFAPEWECNLIRFRDFAEIVSPHRPAPSFEQWMWLYANLGCRHPNLPISNVCRIMAGRDFLLPFLKTAPDQRLRALLQRCEGDPEQLGADELSYPMLEEALQGDQPAKVKFYRSLSRVDHKRVLERALILEKPRSTVALLTESSEADKAQKIIFGITNWENPMILLERFAEQDINFMRSWRDEWGNSLFWYLYFREPVLKEMAIFLNELDIAFDEKNSWGISPADLWKYYRPRIVF